MHLDLSRHIWHQEEGVYVCGFCYDNNQVVSGQNLARHFASASDEASLLRLLREANGQFAVIVNRENLKAAAVDRIRSIPIYYNGSTIADQPYSLSHDGRVDRMALAEYHASGNTFAGKTLLKDIRQVPAAAMVCWHGTEAKTVQYWSFECHSEEERRVTVEELRGCIEGTFTHTIGAIGNRPVTIPLSGGYDSRLIAAMLRKNGIDEAVCYHIGHNGSDEERYARTTAEKLGFRYILIDGPDLAYKNTGYLNEAEFADYYRFVGDYTNFVWLYEYFGIKRMIEQGEIKADTVFIPGHSGDFLAGSHIRKGCVTPSSSVRELALSIVLRSFEYRASSSIVKEVTGQFKKAIDAGISPVSAYQWFIMQNRQAQQIVNSTKVYGFFGHEVLLPLWDNELVNIFRTAPYEQLCDCKLYNDCVKQIFTEAGLSTEKPEGSIKPATLSKTLIKRLLPKAIVNRMVHIGDETGEDIMCQPMLQQLVKTGRYPSSKHFTSSNEIIKDWYELMALSR